MADLIASARSMTTVADNQYVAIGQPKGSITPATMTAMVGIQKSDGSAIDVAPNVKTAMAKLQTVADSSDYPANVNAQTALTNLTNTQAKIYNPQDCGGFGAIVSQATAHCEDSKNLMASQQFLKTQTYPDFGSGINNFSDMPDRGMTTQFGDLSGAGAALSSTGGMFDGINVKDIGTPGGIAQSLNNNKLGNATGLNQKLVANGVDLNNLTDPSYRDKISSSLSSVNDPAAIDASAEQFEQSNPFAGLPSYSGTDSSIYKQPSFTGVTTPTTTSGVSTAFGAPSTSTATTAFSTSGTSFGATSAPEVTTGGIQSLKDLGDYNKTADPSLTSGLNTDLEGIGTKLSDMGGGTMVDSSQATSFFGSINKPSTPLMDSAHPNLNSLMTDSEMESEIENMIGLQSGSTAFPSAQDILGPVGGSPELDALAEGVTDEKVAALNSSLTKSNSLIDAAGIQATTGAQTQTLSKSMGFATNLHKYGKDQSSGGVGTMLKNMANSSTKYGEGVKASIDEGKNNDLFAQNGIGPLQTNPYENVPSYVGTDGSLQTNPQIKMMGGG